MVDQNTQFYAILTNVGAAKQANADALGLAWKITHLAVGDANGTDPTPNATQTRLINEWRRAPLNQLKVDEKDPSIIVAEQVIPADVGGKWIREIGLYDADGDLVAIANCAPTYKPLLSQGSGRTQVVRMSLVVSSAANVELKIDPSVVLATREWVTEELARQDFKHSVLVATTAGINLTGLQTIDGVALTAGARVLVKNQASAKENGIYTVVSGGPWTRTLDANSNAKVTPGLLVLVERGTVNGDSAWQLVTDAPISLGTTALAFEMAFGRTGVAPNTYRSVQIDKYGRVVAASNPTTVEGYGITDVYTKDQTYSRQETASAISTAVDTAVAALVDSSPSALDTLKELAEAIGNDPNFANSMVKELAKKAGLDSPKFSGTPETPTPSPSSTGLQVANMAALVAAVGASARQFRANIIGISANTTLTAAQVGNAIQFNGGPYTLALPAVASVGVGASVMLRNPGTNAQNIVVASSGYIVEGGSTAGSMTLKPLEWVELTTGGSSWFVVGRGKVKEVAELDSPTFTGTPEAPTQALGNNSKRLSTTEFVQSALAAFGVGAQNAPLLTDLNTAMEGGFWKANGGAANGVGTGRVLGLTMPWGPDSALQILSQITAAGTPLHWRAQVAGKWTDWTPVAGLVSPSFAGTPTAPTAKAGTNTDQLATMAAILQGLAAVGLGTDRAPLCPDVDAQVASGLFYVSTTKSKMPFSNNGFLLQFPWEGDSAAMQIYVAASINAIKYRTKSSGSWRGWNDFALLASPSFTGDVSVPTRATSDRSANAANTQFVANLLASLGWGTSDLLDLPRGVDLNTLNVGGSYQVNDVANGPPGRTGGVVFVVGSNAQLWTHQLMFPQAVNVMYHRCSSGSDGAAKWSDWEEIPTLTATGKAISTAMASYGIGGFNGKQVADINTLTEGGITYCFNPSNGPVGTAGQSTANGYVLSMQYGDGTLYAAQMFIPSTGANQDTLHYRRMVNGTWGKWNTTATTDQLDERVTQAAPPGQLAHFARSTPPPGWLKRNGAAVSRTTYAALFAAIGTNFGAGDGKTTFNVPDDRELIDRAWTDGANGADAGRALFSTQAGQNESHAHGGTITGAGQHSHSITNYREIVDQPENGRANAVYGDQNIDGATSSTTGLAGLHTHGLTIDSSGGNETRMANRAYLACIKY